MVFFCFGESLSAIFVSQANRSLYRKFVLSLVEQYYLLLDRKCGPGNGQSGRNEV